MVHFIYPVSHLLCNFGFEIRIGNKQRQHVHPDYMYNLLIKQSSKGYLKSEFNNTFIKHILNEEKQRNNKRIVYIAFMNVRRIPPQMYHIIILRVIQIIYQSWNFNILKPNVTCYMYCSDSRNTHVLLGGGCRGRVRMVDRFITNYAISSNPT